MPSGLPPSNATLLRRLAPASLKDPNLFRPREDWYDPATRTASLYLLADSTDDGTFNLDSTIVVDRWCLAPGAAPYAERRVTHDGTGGIVFTDVNGVAACQITCTLVVALTAPPTSGGHTTLTATVGGGVGTVLLSLDDFQTPGTAPTGTTLRYYDRPAGAYTITARETRPGGCTATATLVVAVPYGPRYQLDFKDRANRTGRVLILEREYAGTVEILPHGQKTPVVLDWPGGATDHLFSQLVHGSECQLALYQTYADQFTGLFSGDERLHRVDYLLDNALVWRGFLHPNQYDARHLAPPAAFALSATDGLAALSDTPFVGSSGEALRGDWTALQVLRFCLDQTSTGLPVHVRTLLYPAGATQTLGALEQARFDVAAFVDEKGKAWDCGKVLLEAILRPLGARLHQWAGTWWLLRLSDALTTPMPYARYAPDRAADVLSAGLVSVLPAATGQPWWQGGSQRQGLRPAVAAVSVALDPGEPVNQLAFAQPRNTDLPAAVPASWSQSPRPPTGAAQLQYLGVNKAPRLRLIGTPGGSDTPDTAAWVQTPPTTPLPIGTLPNAGGVANGQRGFVIVTALLKPYGNTPQANEAAQATLWLAVKIGSKWVLNNGAESDAPLYQFIRFADATPVKLNLIYGLFNLLPGQRTVSVRLCGPTGSGTACTVDVTELKVLWANDNVSARSDSEDPADLLDTYTDTYRGTTRQLVRDRDEAEKLLVGDTRQVRRAGTILDAQGRPAQGWFEAREPAALRELGDYLVRDRLLWQGGPAQTLTGLLRGDLADGPGTVLTDPGEARLAVYNLTSATLDAAACTWQVRGVQNRQLLAPADELPDNAIYFDDGSAWQDENDAVFVYENAL